MPWGFPNRQRGPGSRAVLAVIGIANAIALLRSLGSFLSTTAPLRRRGLCAVLRED
jgi:hypothetical protein